MRDDQLRFVESDQLRFVIIAAQFVVGLRPCEPHKAAGRPQAKRSQGAADHS